MKKLLYAVGLVLLSAVVVYSAQQLINVGTNPNDGTGDAPRPAGLKINADFTELYNFIMNPNLTNWGNTATSSVPFLAASQTYAGVNQFTNAGNTFRGSFTGGGQSLTNTPSTLGTSLVGSNGEAGVWALVVGADGKLATNAPATGSGTVPSGLVTNAASAAVSITGSGSSTVLTTNSMNTSNATVSAQLKVNQVTVSGGVTGPLSQDLLYSTAAGIAAGNGLMLGYSDNNPNFMASNTLNAVNRDGASITYGGLIMGRFDSETNTTIEAYYGSIADVDTLAGGDTGSAVVSRTGSYIGVNFYGYSSLNTVTADWSAMISASMNSANGDFLNATFGALILGQYDNTTNDLIAAVSSIMNVHPANNLTLNAYSGGYIGGNPPAGTTLTVSGDFYQFGNGTYTGNLNVLGYFVGNVGTTNLTGALQPAQFNGSVAVTNNQSGITLGGTFSGNAVALTNDIRRTIIPLTANYTVSAAQVGNMLTTNFLFSVASNPSNAIPLRITFPSPPASGAVSFLILNNGTNAVALTNATGFTFQIASGNSLAYTNVLTLPAYFNKPIVFENLNTTNWIVIDDIITKQQRQDEFMTNATSGTVPFNLTLATGADITKQSFSNVQPGNGLQILVLSNGVLYAGTNFTTNFVSTNVFGPVAGLGLTMAGSATTLWLTNLPGVLTNNSANATFTGTVQAGTFIGNASGLTGSAAGMSSYSSTNLLNPVVNNGVAPYPFKLGDATIEGGGTNRPLTLPVNPPAGTTFVYDNTNANGSYYWTNTGSPTPTIGGRTSWAFGVGVTNASVVQYDGSNYIFLAMPNSGGSSGSGGGPVLKYLFAGQGGGGNVALSAGPTEFAIGGWQMHGASGVGGRFPMNTPATFTNLQLVIDASPTITNGQYIAIYPLTNGVRDTSFTWNFYGYSSNPFVTNTAAGVVYNYTPSGVNPELSFVISNMTLVNNCQFTLSLPYY